LYIDLTFISFKEITSCIVFEKNADINWWVYIKTDICDI
jgi:hypothetical protein